MTDSLVLLLNRANELHIIDPDTVPHSDDLHPIMLIAAAVINAGYEGVAVDEKKLSDGRYLQSIDVNLATPEGVILQRLQHIVNSGGTLPQPEAVLAAIRQQYAGSGTAGTVGRAGQEGSAQQGSGG